MHHRINPVFSWISGTVGLLPVLIALAILFLCCAAQKGPIPQTETHGNLPRGEGELLSLAHHSYRFQGPAEDVRLSLEAAECVLQRQPQNELANFYAARAISWLIEFGDGDVKTLADRGYTYARAAEKLDANRPEYAFFVGAFLGYLTRESPATHLGSLKEIYGEMDRAVKADTGYEEGAPWRALGMLLVKSPAWPLGVGDTDAGIDYLKKAAKNFPDYPANHLYLAEAYLDSGRTEDAVGSMERALETLSAGRWGVPGQVWSKYLERLRAKAAEKTSSKVD